MDTFFRFAGEHPWLTFFLAVIITEMIVRVVFILRGGSKKVCSECGKGLSQKNP